MRELLQAALFYQSDFPQDTPEQDASLQGLGALSKETRQSLHNVHLHQSRKRLRDLLT